MSGEMERTGQIWEKCRKDESDVVRDQTRRAVCLREWATRMKTQFPVEKGAQT